MRMMIVFALTAALVVVTPAVSTVQAGINEIDDGGATWTARKSGILNDRADAIVFDPHDPSRVYLAPRMAGFHIGHNLAAAGWTFTQSGSNSGYSLAEYTDTSYFFNDGFETGDTSRWAE